MPRNPPWTDREIEAIVKDHFDMYEKWRKGISFSKTDHRRALQGSLEGRSEGSIELKHQNISSVMMALGQEFLPGYKPKDHYQQALVAPVRNELRRRGLDTMIEPEDYDKKDPQSILRHARRLIGKTLLDVIIGEGREDEIGIERKKGAFGTELERYFEIDAGNDPYPDLIHAGVELKSTPVMPGKDRYLAKERISLGMIDYEKLAGETWEASSFLRKNNLLLIVFYEYLKGESYLKYPIVDAILWGFEDEDREVIRNDWHTIQDKVKVGKAHELSEGDTFYLGAARKGHKEKGRKQPFSDILAPQRALSLKQTYVTSIVKQLDNVTPIHPRVRSLEDVTREKLAPYMGMDGKEIGRKVGFDWNPKDKGWYFNLVKRMFGVTTRYIEEFEKADVQVKTVRLQKNGRPEQSMSFPKFEYTEIAGQEWEESKLFGIVNRRFFFVIYQEDGDRTYLRDAFFWVMPFQDRESVRAFWLDVRQRIRDGRSNDLPGLADHPISHIRPKGKNNKDTSRTPQGDDLPTQCHWLNARYIASIVKEHWKKSPQRSLDDPSFT